MLFQFTKSKRNIQQELLNKPNNNHEPSNYNPKGRKTHEAIRSNTMIKQKQQTPWNNKSNQNMNNPLIHKKKEKTSPDENKYIMKSTTNHQSKKGKYGLITVEPKREKAKRTWRGGFGEIETGHWDWIS